MIEHSLWYSSPTRVSKPHGAGFAIGKMNFLFDIYFRYVYI